MSVTCGQCDARPTVTFPAARHHRLLAGTKLYCLVTDSRVLTTCQGCTRQRGSWDSNQRPTDCKSGTILLHNLSLFVSMAIFQVNLCWPVFIEAKDDGGGGDSWSYKTRKAPVKSSPPTNQHQTFYRPDSLPVAQPTVSKALKGKYHIP